MMFSYDHDMGWWGYASMGIGMLLFWALLIAGIIALIRFISGSVNSGTSAAPLAMPRPLSPEQVLADRFARGEIDEDEFQHRIAILRGHAGP